MQIFDDNSLLIFWTLNNCLFLFSDSNGMETNIAKDDVITRWRELNGTCSYCCSGSECNTGIIPTRVEQSSNAPQARKTVLETVFSLLALYVVASFITSDQ